MEGDNEDVCVWTLCVRLARAIGAFAIACVMLVIVLALFGRDLGMSSFLDQWFSSWSELELTVAGALMLGLTALAANAVKRSEARLRGSRSISLHKHKD